VQVLTQLHAHWLQVVLKPSELTPLTALALAALAERAGVPEGVLNIVVGDAKPIGDALLASDTVSRRGDGLDTFRASIRRGGEVMNQAESRVELVLCTKQPRWAACGNSSSCTD